MSYLDPEEDNLSDEAKTILKQQATEILDSRSHEGLENVLRDLWMETNKSEYQTADDLFKFCITTFPDSLSLMLLQVYLASPDGVIRFQSIFRLSAILHGSFGEFHPDTVYKLKPLVLQCLTMQETKQSHFKIFRSIVFFVASSILMLHDTWDQLNDCILWLLPRYPLKAFYVFHYLPANYENLIIHETVMPLLLDKASMFLMNPVNDLYQNWNLALQTVFKAGVVLLSCSNPNPDTINLNLIAKAGDIAVTSAKNVVVVGMKRFLKRGFGDLINFLARDATLSGYSEEQKTFVTNLAFNIAACYKANDKAMSIAGKMRHVVQEPSTYYKDADEKFEQHWYAHLMHSTPMEIFSIFSLSYLDERSRDVAIRVLNVVLLDHISKKVTLDIAVMRQLQPLLITCLNQQRDSASNSIFHVLGQVVHHVAYEMMLIQGETWEELGVYIVSKSQPEFERAVYIFQCLLMPLKDDEFVTSVTGSLLPEITKGLDEMLFNVWGLAFIGALCAGIHLLRIPSHTETVNAINHNVVHSVTKLVESRRGVGIVTRAFRDLESIVNKQLNWLGTNEHNKYLKGVQQIYMDTGKMEGSGSHCQGTIKELVRNERIQIP